MADPVLGHRAAPGPYSIGSDHWPGLSKLIEEAGEVCQVAGKLLGNGGASAHWDGTDLRERLQAELGDLIAAVNFVVMHNALDAKAIGARVAKKTMLFEEWHQAPVPTPTPAEKSGGGQ